MRLFIFIIIFFHSCSPIMKTYYGVKQPKVETEESLREFLTDVGISDTIQIYVFKDTNAYQKVAAKGIDLPDAMFFNKKRYYVPYNISPNECNSEVSPFLDNSESINQMAYIDSVRLEDFGDYLVDITTKEKLKMDKDADSYVILTWAKFIGRKLNKQKSLDFIQHYNLALERGNKVQLIFLNLDLIE